MMRIPYHSHFLMRESHYRYVCCHHWPVGFKLTHPSVSIDHGAVSSGARSQGNVDAVDIDSATLPGYPLTQCAVQE